MGCTQNICQFADNHNYLLDLFEYLELKNISDVDYVNFIYNFVESKELIDSSNDTFDSYHMNASKDTCCDLSNKRVIKTFENSEEYEELKRNSPSKISKYSERKYCNVYKNKNLPLYLDNLIDQIFEKYLLINSLSNKKISKSICDIKDESQFTKKDDSYEKIQIQIMNNFFIHLKSILNDYNLKVDFIISLIFLTNTSFTSFPTCLVRLFRILKKQYIIKKDGNFFYINNKQISQILTILSKIFIIEALDFAILLVSKELKNDFYINYKKVYNEKTIFYLVNKYFDYTFIEDMSLAYFLKDLLPMFNSIFSLVNSIKNTNLELRNIEK